MARIIAGVLLMLITASPVRAESFYYPEIAVDIGAMQNTVEFLTTLRPHRNFSNPASLDKAAAYIEDNFKKYGLATELQAFEAFDNTYSNVIGTIGPMDAKRIVVGAHYDVFDDQPGADDNASAVAGLLEAARLATNMASHLNYRIDFVAYSLEEPPYFRTEKMGSYVHAHSLHESGAAVQGMICLEMIGFFTDQEKSQKYPFPGMKLFYPSTGNFIAVVGNIASRGFVKEVKTHMQAASIAVESLAAPSIVIGIDFSDHRNYWVFDYPAVMITDTSFYRNPHYHEPSDTVDTLDFDKMREVVKGVVWTIVNLK